MPQQVGEAEVDDEREEPDDAELDHLAVDDVHRARAPTRIRRASPPVGGGAVVGTGAAYPRAVAILAG